MSAVAVSVPATSANLGPGFDSLGAALTLRLDLTVERDEAFSIDADPGLPLDRTNLLVRAFETILPADGFRFVVRSGIPRCGGFGSSAAAILAGVLAAKALGGECSDPLAAAAAIEGHADNVSAAMLGGVVVAQEGAVSRIDPPTGIRLIAVVPDEPVATSEARSVLPESVPLGAAAANAASAVLLGAGLAASDPTLIGRGLGDRLHQDSRASLFPRSADLLAKAPRLGAIGATISGAGPSVLVWVAEDSLASVSERLEAEITGWARAIAVNFDPVGATVDGKAVP